MRNSLRIFLFMLVTVSTALANSYERRGRSYSGCTFRASLRTTYSAYRGEGQSRYEAVENARIACIQDGTTSDACERGVVQVSEDCGREETREIRCTLRTTYAVYEGYGSTRREATENARIACVRSGTTAYACDNGRTACSF